MPSKLSIHLSAYPNNAFNILEKMQPSIVKVFNQNSEMNIDEIRRRCGALIVYRAYIDIDFHQSADAFFAQLQPSLVKLRGRGIIWEGLNEPVPSSVNDALLLNAWYVRFAQIMHAQGEMVAGFSWSTGNPTPANWDLIVPYVVDAAAAVDVHAFHEYYNQAIQGQDWARYRLFEAAMPAYARKPVVITEAGYDDSGQAQGGYIGKISNDEYLNILKQYDQILLQDPYVLGATIYQWGDGNWPSFDLGPVINPLSDYVVSVGQGYHIPHPWPLPIFGRSLTATPSTIKAGQSSTLAWSAENAASVTLNGQPVAASGTMIVTPPATTTYVLHIVSPDGSTQDLTATVVVEASATPVLVQPTLSPTTLSVGQLLNVSVTIKNNSGATLATQGPDPGFVYDEGDTFYTRGFPDQKGAWRIGVDFDGRASTVVDHPYRWGLGAPLAPGQSATITGSIRLKTPQQVKYWMGLVQEQTIWLQDNQGAQTITVTPAPPTGTVLITNVSLTPTMLNAGQLLNVSITVQNNTTAPLPTQGPNSGLIYVEGDTFYTRGFPDQNGAYRVGIDFDGRASTVVDHPYRWGLGAPLAPGQSATITGAIRLRTPRAIKYWAGLVREQIKWLQDNQGAQVVTVNAAPSAAQIVDAAFAPTTVPAGQVLNVSITVFNNTNQTLATEGPDPGFAYVEGDTFYTRNFPDINGAFRVGVDFDGRDSGVIDHPYRWGLGAPLAPGQFATVTGTILLKTPRTINYWAGLVREQAVWLQDHFGTQPITVTP